MKIGKLLIQNVWYRELLLFVFLILVTFLNEREDFTSDHGWVDGVVVFMLLYIHLQVHRFTILPLLDRRSYGLYVISALGLVVFFVVVAMVCDFYFTNFGWFDDLKTENIGYLIRFYFFSFAMTVPLIVAVHSAFKQYDAQLKMEQSKRVLQEMELNLLKVQANPHFLFNALNSLYGLSLEKPDLLPSRILQLSDIMRYQVEWSSVKWIKLHQEIFFLEQYIDFEKDRQRAYIKVNSTFDIDAIAMGREIAPMISIFFVENAFKHVRKCPSIGCFVHIDMYTDGLMLYLNIQNTYNDVEFNINSLQIGIDNVKRRLKLLYPNAFKLTIEPNDGLFKVHLVLQLQR